MPCKGCDNPEYKGTVKLRYLGSINDWGGHSFVNGRIYTMPARYANREAYPLFELVAVMPGTVIPEKYRYIEKRVEVPVERVLVEAPVAGDEAEEEVYLPEPDEPVEPVVIVRTEMPKPGEKPWDSSISEDDDLVEVGEYASSIKDASTGFTQSDMIAGMDKETVRAYIKAMTGEEPDGRWGIDKLIEEAQKLQ